jgi:hypothetical protein
MNELLIIISAGMLGAGLFIFDPYMAIVSQFANFKPFNCVYCLTFWITAIVFYFIDFPIYYAGISSVIGELTYRKLVNYEE